MIVESDPDRLRVLELVRAVILGQPPDRWEVWWHGDPRPWLGELLRDAWLSCSAQNDWDHLQTHLRRGLSELVLPRRIGFAQQALLGRLLPPRRQMARLLALPNRVRRSGRFLDLVGRHRLRNALSAIAAAALVRLFFPSEPAAARTSASRLARQLQGRLTSLLLACDPGQDECLRRWLGLSLDLGQAPQPASAEVIRSNWQRVTLLPRQTGIPPAALMGPAFLLTHPRLSLPE